MTNYRALFCLLVKEIGNPLHYSCLENPRDGGAWLAAIHGIAQSRTWLRQLSSNKHGPQPCLTQWNYESCFVRPPKMDGSWWSVLTKHGPLEKGMANHFGILALRTPRLDWAFNNWWIKVQVFQQRIVGSFCYESLLW